MEYRIAVLGSRDSILGFQALGLSAFPVQNPEEARTVLHRIVKEDYGIIYLTEDLAKDLEGHRPLSGRAHPGNHTHSRWKRSSGHWCGED